MFFATAVGVWREGSGVQDAVAGGGGLRGSGLHVPYLHGSLARRAQAEPQGPQGSLKSILGIMALYSGVTSTLIKVII